MSATGKLNGLTDVEGILVGNYTDTAAVSGVTVVLSPAGATGAVDVRGGAPGTRETDLLAPVNLVEKVQAVVLSGGSVYGLAAADGVVRWLAERGLGFPLGGGQVAPIVPAAVLYDLGRGPQFGGRGLLHNVDKIAVGVFVKDGELRDARLFEAQVRELLLGLLQLALLLLEFTVEFFLVLFDRFEFGQVGSLLGEYALLVVVLLEIVQVHVKQGERPAIS